MKQLEGFYCETAREPLLENNPEEEFHCETIVVLYYIATAGLLLSMAAGLLL